MRGLLTIFAVLVATALCLPSSSYATDVEVDDAVAADRAAAAAMTGNYRRAEELIGKISRIDLRDAGYFRIAALAARRAKPQLARRLNGKIGNAGVAKDAAMELAIVLARQGRIDDAERDAAALDPARRQQVRAVIAAVLAARGELREAWRTARRTNDVTQRNDNMITLRGGFARGLSLRSAIGVALGAENKNARVRSLVAVAWSLVRQGRAANGLTALSHVYDELRTGISDARLTQQTAADRAMILTAMNDFVGARQAAEEIDAGTLREYLLRHIRETRNFADN
jgi:hypothetical protein